MVTLRVTPPPIVPVYAGVGGVYTRPRPPFASAVWAGVWAWSSRSVGVASAWPRLPVRARRCGIAERFAPLRFGGTGGGFGGVPRGSERFGTVRSDGRRRRRRDGAGRAPGVGAAGERGGDMAG